MAAPLRVAVAMHTFPVLTETFVLEPIVHLLEAGHDVSILALYRGHDAHAHPALRDHSLLERTTFLIDDRAGKAPLRKAVTGARRAVMRGAAFGVPWGRVLRDVSRPALRKAAPELVLAALGANAAWRGRRPDFDVIHAHMGRVGLVLQYLRDWGLLRAPQVTTFHGSDALVEPRRHRPGLYDRLFAGSDLITANSRFLKGELERLGAPTDRCRVVPVGVALTEFPFRPRRMTDTDELRLLTVARLDPVKGVEYGIRAVEILHREGVDVRYTVVGDGPERPRLEALIRRSGLNGVVRLAGSLTWDRVPGVYGDHHVFMLPGVIAEDGGREALGRVLLEAQAAGMPVVATEVGGMGEAVGDGAGLLVAPGDPDALAGALRSLLDRRDEWPAMGRRGRDHVEAGFDSRRLLAQTVDLYRELARTGRSQP